MKTADHELYMTKIKAELKKGFADRWPYREPLEKYILEMVLAIMDRCAELSAQDARQAKIYKLVSVGLVSVNAFIVLFFMSMLAGIL